MSHRIKQATQALGHQSSIQSSARHVTKGKSCDVHDIQSSLLLNLFDSPVPVKLFAKHLSSRSVIYIIVSPCKRMMFLYPLLQPHLQKVQNVSIWEQQNSFQDQSPICGQTILSRVAIGSNRMKHNILSSTKRSRRLTILKNKSQSVTSICQMFKMMPKFKIKLITNKCHESCAQCMYRYENVCVSSQIIFINWDLLC